MIFLVHCVDIIIIIMIVIITINIAIPTPCTMFILTLYITH